jgi:hypothetical protein
VASCEGESNTSFAEVKALAASQVVIAFPEMEIRVTNTEYPGQPKIYLVLVRKSRILMAGSWSISKSKETWDVSLGIPTHNE